MCEHKEFKSSGMSNKQTIFFWAMTALATWLMLAALYFAATVKPDERDFGARADSTLSARPIGRASFVNQDTLAWVK